jgi:hypothetical protein
MLEEQKAGEVVRVIKVKAVEGGLNAVSCNTIRTSSAVEFSNSYWSPLLSIALRAKVNHRVIFQCCYDV